MENLSLNDWYIFVLVAVVFVFLEYLYWKRIVIVFDWKGTILSSIGVCFIGAALIVGLGGIYNYNCIDYNWFINFK